MAVLSKRLTFQDIASAMKNVIDDAHRYIDRYDILSNTERHNKRASIRNQLAALGVDLSNWAYDPTTNTKVNVRERMKAIMHTAAVELHDAGVFPKKFKIQQIIAKDGGKFMPIDDMTTGERSVYAAVMKAGKKYKR